MVRKCGQTCAFTLEMSLMRTAFIIVYVNKRALSSSANARAFAVTYREYYLIQNGHPENVDRFWKNLRYTVYKVR